MNKIEQAREALMKVDAELAYQGYSEIGPLREDVREALAALSTPVDGVGAEPRVKPLEWIETAALGNARKLIALDCFHNEFGRIDLPKSDEEIEEYKAARQKRYDACILSALTTPETEARLRERVARSPLAGKYGDVLGPFVAMMETELHANSGKGDRPGWLEMDRKTALLEIFYHLAKLQKAVKDDDRARIREYGADVANMAMMLVDVCGAIPSEPRLTQSNPAPAAGGQQEAVAWRVKDFADGWILVHTEAEAQREAEGAGNLVQPLYLSARPAEQAVTEADVRRAGDILMQHGLNAPEQVIYQAARAALEAALQPQPQPVKGEDEA